eukprot:1136786-Pelagomonas_calceolata.AAC.3
MIFGRVAPLASTASAASTTAKFIRQQHHAQPWQGHHAHHCNEWPCLVNEPSWHPKQQSTAPQ